MVPGRTSSVVRSFGIGAIVLGGTLVVFALWRIANLPPGCEIGVAEGCGDPSPFLWGGGLLTIAGLVLLFVGRRK